MNNLEIFRPIITAKADYTGLYEVSNHGRVKSLERKARLGSNYRIVKEKFLKPEISNGYYQVTLCNCKQEQCNIHTIEWDAFGDEKRNGRKHRVDHKDGNKLNNMFDNFQLLTNRQNVSKGYIRKGMNSRKVSQYIGVSWHKRRQKWQAQIYINGKYKHLGYFTDEYEAHLAYQKAFLESEMG
jgi:hypothetical protein